MSIKRFCDICGLEAGERSMQEEFQTKIHYSNDDSSGMEIVGIKLTRSLNGAWNGGDICNNCLAKALEACAAVLCDEASEAEIIPVHYRGRGDDD